MAIMIYKPGSRYEFHGKRVDTKVVDASELGAHLDDGWSESPSECYDIEDDAMDIDAMGGADLKELLQAHGVENIPRKLEDRREMLRKVMFVSEGEIGGDGG